MRIERIANADNDSRYVPIEGVLNFNSVAHESRYNWLLNNWNLADKAVLDYGCGVGYGSYLLASKAKLVDAIDKSKTAINYAQSKFHSTNVAFLNADACSSETVNLLKNKPYDIIVSFDVIEHIEHYFDYLENICTLMKDDGTLIISSPNRLQLFRWCNEWNKAHFQEFSPYQFRIILSLYFNDVVMVAQHFKDTAKGEIVRQNTKNYLNMLEWIPKNALPIIPRIPSFIRVLLKSPYILVNSLKQMKNGKNGDGEGAFGEFKLEDIEFYIEPGDSFLEKSFGLVAICSKPNRIERKPHG